MSIIEKPSEKKPILNIYIENKVEVPDNMPKSLDIFNLFKMSLENMPTNSPIKLLEHQSPTNTFLQSKKDSMKALLKDLLQDTLL